jgi:uracil-DNA glycosylase family 4
MSAEPEVIEPAGLAQKLLDLYRAAGVTDVVGEEAVDWLARGDDSPGSWFSLAEADGRAAEHPTSRCAPDTGSKGAPVSDLQQAQTGPRVRPRIVGAAQADAGGVAGSAIRQFPTASPDEAVTSARAAAGEAQSLGDLRARLEGFGGCALKATAKNLCFFRGAERARLMIVGEAPGRDEDLSGVPFVGPAGQLLDKMLAAIGLGEADVHITNTVYWRPPGNRTPSPQETQACRPFLDRQIELVGPKVIVLMGGAAANSLLGVPGGIMRLRGTWRDIEIGGRPIKVLPTLHPAFLLRSPAHKKQAWRDMLALIEALDAKD